MCLGGGRVKIPPPAAPPQVASIEVAPDEGVGKKRRKARLGKRQLRRDIGGGVGTGLGIPTKPTGPVA
jgi:hypothetical protein